MHKKWACPKLLFLSLIRRESGDGKWMETWSTKASQIGKMANSPNTKRTPWSTRKTAWSWEGGTESCGMTTSALGARTTLFATFLSKVPFQRQKYSSALRYCSTFYFHCSSGQSKCFCCDTRPKSPPLPCVDTGCLDTWDGLGQCINVTGTKLNYKVFANPMCRF